MRNRAILVGGALLLTLGVVAPAGFASAGGTSLARVKALSPRMEAGGGSPGIGSGRVSPAGRLLRSQGYLVPNQAAYEAAKAARAAVGRFGTRRAVPRIVTPAPGFLAKWNGLADANYTPSDSTGAIGPSRYIETVNSKYAIYDRGGSLINTNGLAVLAGAPAAEALDMTDPQMIFDPGTNRFYYVILDVARANGDGPYNRLDFGFSRTSAPTSSATTQWCKYNFYFTQGIPDYPKLGDTSNFELIGANFFNDNLSFNHAVAYWVSKPPAGTGCPRVSTLHYGQRLMNLPGSSTSAWTPVPANQTDPSGTGYVLSGDYAGGGGTFSRLIEETVTRNSHGNAVFTAPVAAPVSSFDSPPAPAAQPGTALTLDTLDGRLTQAVSAVDPANGGMVTIWTQHTVVDPTNSAVSDVQWFALTASTHTAFDQGFVGDAASFFFNGSVAPDRKVSGTTRAFGDTALMNLNTSSSSNYVDVELLSMGPSGTSNLTQVVASSAAENDFACGNFGLPPNLCRWGDYSAVTPDPASSSLANHGAFWLTNMWVAGNDGAGANPDWGSENAGVLPSIEAKITGPSRLMLKDLVFATSWAPVPTKGDVTGGVTDFNWQYRTAPYNGSFGAETETDHVVYTSRTNADIGATPGNTYCFSAAPTDGATAFGWTPESCAATPLDDRGFGHGSAWAKRVGSGWYEGTFLSSSTHNAAITLAGVQAKHIDLVVGRCPTCGTVRVYLGSTLLRTISLHASVLQKDVLLTVASFAGVHAGTLKVVVYSASGHPTYIDGVDVSRT